MLVQHIKKIVGSIVLSALSLFCISFLAHVGIQFFDPSFHILANRGAGKILFTSLVIAQILLLLCFQSNKFRSQWFDTSVLFITQHRWVATFTQLFILFFILHALCLSIAFFTGHITYNPSWGALSFKLSMRILFGFVATFFLAWTEELIFRGTLYPYFEQYLKPITSVFFTSLIFMLVHDLSNPLNLVSIHWKLGLGLFLLGILLNLVFVITKKLYVGMGIHAGLVFVKVVLRRIPIFMYLPSHEWAWWFAKDLREAHLTHILFIMVNIVLIVRYKKLLTSKTKE